MSRPGEPVSLVDHFVWENADPDPFPDRPDTFECIGGVGWEDIIGEDSFFIDTDTCEYVTATQPSLTEIARGDTIAIRFWNYVLEGDPAEAHVAIMLGETLVWETRIAIPGPEGLTTETLEAPEDLPKGSPVYIHVHNHGPNSYNLIELSVAAQ